jgi:hypothetical protein
LLVRTDEFDGFDGALIEQRAVRETDVGAVPHFDRGAEQELGQALSAEFLGNRQTDPARFGELRVRFFKAFGSGDVAVDPLAAFLIALLIDRIQYTRGKVCGFFKNGVDDVERFAGAGEFCNFFDTRQLAQNELHVA